ncbi:hypothetical protein QCN27_14040 [Cereibacter sp. SYSU M97828]|nr:hypothetical protein [Cereibacter flavus]
MKITTDMEKTVAAGDGPQASVPEPSQSIFSSVYDPIGRTKGTTGRKAGALKGPQLETLDDWVWRNCRR